MGLHARPACMLVKHLNQFSSKVTFSCNKVSVDAKQVMNLLLLGAIQNTKVDVLIEGADADLVLSTLIDIFENQFGDLQYDSSRTG